MATLEMGNNGVGAEVPSPEEVFEMFERGEFDTGAEATGAEGQPVVAEEEVIAWAHRRAQDIRAAGHRGTWEGRRGIRERTFADREKPSFVGRYDGKAEFTPQLLETEYGESDPEAVFAATT